MPGKVYRFERSTLLEGADVERVWDAATTWRGVNAELMPLARMTHPPGRGRIDARAEREPTISWILLFGLIPVDRHRLHLDRFDAGGRRFFEHSANLALRHWIHRRSLRSEAGGVRVTDRCALVARAGGCGPLMRLVYAAVFAHRHRRLRIIHRR
jgi:hypothetical protein